jgi:hypothetical protein
MQALKQRQRLPFTLAVLAGLGLAAAAGRAPAQPAPYSDEPAQYRSNRPYPDDVKREQKRQEAAAEARQDAAAPPAPRDPSRDPLRYPPGGPAHETTAEAMRTAPVRDESPLVFTGGVDFRDQYFFRGYNYVSSGFIAQPYVQLGYTIFRDENLALTPHGGAWFDFTENQGPNPPTHFSEFRGNGGLAVQTGNLALDFQYVQYRSPSDAFQGTVHEVGVDLYYDDGAAWRNDRCPVSGLNPSFSLYYELKDERDNDYNTFVGLGLEPALRPVDVATIPVTVSFPLTLGGSYDGYYKDSDGHNANFGYWEAGVRVALPLGRGAYGMRWSLDAEVDYVRLLADSAEAANGNDNDDIVFRLGLAFR